MALFMSPWKRVLVTVGRRLKVGPGIMRPSVLLPLYIAHQVRCMLLER